MGSKGRRNTSFVSAVLTPSQKAYGVEVEYNWADADGSDDLVQPGAATATFTTEVDATAALRGKIGYAMDRSMIYATGGFAWIDYSISEFVPAQPSFTNDYPDSGWTLGVGFEHTFNDSWSGLLDYRYSDFGTIDDLPAQWDLTTSEVRIGVAKKF